MPLLSTSAGHLNVALRLSTQPRCYQLLIRLSAIAIANSHSVKLSAPLLSTSAGHLNVALRLSTAAKLHFNVLRTDIRAIRVIRVQKETTHSFKSDH